MSAPIPILYEDDDLLFIDKPSGLLSVPGKTEPDCVEARLKAANPDVLTVHRLDMATSGVMVFAKNKAAQRHLGLQFERRHAGKRYEAIVWVNVEDDGGVIDLPLRADWPNRPRQMVCHEQGKPSLTEWRVIERGDNHTRLLLIPRTGRSHQLRVHLLSLGHPILGDQLYATGDALAASDRLCLHAAELSLFKPTGGKRVTITSPVPF
jgi:tRNA pseudouridine32 synthase/23S rRNA pseudouridine746 synthase